MTDNAGVQFDRAEYETSPGQTDCAECKQPLTGCYYDVNGQTVCERCRYTIETKFTSGSAAGRLLRATGAGVVAAALGSALYYAILALTGYEFGLIAIVVGFAVGTAVRWGSNGRGGWLYQTLAIALTYLAIVSAFIPPMMVELSKIVDSRATTGSAEQAPEATPATQTTEAADADSAEQLPAPPFALMLAIAAVLVIAAPFFAGFENIIELVIIGIGLYEAWKLNKRTELMISGPHALASRPAATVGG